MDRRLLYIMVALLGLAASSSVRGQGADQSSSSRATSDDRDGTHSITGVLLDPSGAAIVKAQVTLLGTATEVVAQTTTDGVGAFRFDNLAPFYQMAVRVPLRAAA